MALSSLTVEARGLDGIPYRVDVNGGGTNLTDSNQTPQQFLVIEGGESEDRGLNPVWPKRLRLFMLDVDLEPLFGEPDRSVPVEAHDISGSSDTLVFRGFMVTDFFGDAPFAPANTVELQALDGLGTLENDGLDQIYGESDEFATYTDAITRILGTLYSMNVEFGVEWYPSEGSLSSSDNPLASTGFNPNNYREDRPDGDWENQLSVLKDLCRSQGLVVQQAERPDGAKWHLRQRDALNPDGTIKVWEYDNAGTLVSGPDTVDRAQTISVSDGDIRPKNSRDFVRRRQVIQVTHNHVEIENFLSDPGFDEDDGSWELGGGADVDGSIVGHDTVGLSPEKTQDNPNLLEAVKTANNTNGEIQDVASQVFGNIVQTPPRSYLHFKATVGAETNVKDPYLLLRIGDRYLTNFRTSTTQDALKGTGELFVNPIDRPIPKGARLPLFAPNESAPAGDISLSRRAEVGTSRLVGDISIDTDKGYEVQYPAFVDAPDDVPIGRYNSNWELSGSTSNYLTVELFIPLVDGAGAAVDGEAQVRLRHIAGSASGTSRTYWDSLEVSIDLNGSPLDQTITQASVPEFGETEAQKARLFSGPTDQNLARVKGDGFEPVSWGLGQGGGDLSLAQLKARLRLQFWRNHNAKWTVTTADRDGSLRLTGDELVSFDGDLYTVHSIKYDPAAGETRATLIRWNDRGTSGIELQTILEQSQSGASSGGGSTVATGGSGTVQDWDNLTGKPFSTLGTGVKSDSNALTVDPTDFAGTGLTEEGSDDLGISDGGVDTLQIATDAVTRDKIGDKAVGTGQIGLNAVTKTRVKDGQTFPINISGDADTVDDYEGSDLAALAEDETVTGRYTFDDEIQADLGLTSGDDLMPDQGYAHGIGSSTHKWLTLDVAELRVSTLVAEKELATVGGRQLVGTANELAEAVSTTDDSIRVKYNNLQDGDFLRFEGGGSVEFMEVIDWVITGTDLSGDVITVLGNKSGDIASGDVFYDRSLGTLTASSVTYDPDNYETNISVQEDIQQSARGVLYIERTVNGKTAYEYVSVNRDLDGTGANSWDQGDGLFSTSQGEGFIDLYAEHSFTDANQSTIAGPTIAFREQGSGGYADVSERAAVGNLHDTFGYASDTYGIAAGDPGGDHFTADPGSGIRLIDGQTDTVTAQLSSQVFSVGPDKDLKYDADTGILSVGGWKVTSNKILSQGETGNGGIDIASGVARSLGGTESYICAHGSASDDPFVSMYYHDDDSFGLIVATDRSNPKATKKVHFGDEMTIEGDLLVDGSVTATEVDVQDLFTVDVTVKNKLTMGTSGEIIDDASPPNYRFSSDGIELRATDTTRAPAREITWREPDLTGDIRGEIYTHNREMSISTYYLDGKDAKTVLTAYDYAEGTTPGTGDNYARIRLFGDDDGRNEVNVILTGDGDVLNIRSADSGGIAFDFDPHEDHLGFRNVYDYSSDPGPAPPSPTSGIRLYVKETGKTTDSPSLWYIDENGQQHRLLVDEVP